MEGGCLEAIHLPPDAFIQEALVGLDKDFLALDGHSTSFRPPKQATKQPVHGQVNMENVPSLDMDSHSWILQDHQSPYLIPLWGIMEDTSPPVGFGVILCSDVD